MNERLKLVLGCGGNKEEKCANCGKQAPVYLSVRYYAGGLYDLKVDDIKFCLPCVESMVEKAKNFETTDYITDEDVNIGC